MTGNKLARVYSCSSLTTVKRKVASGATDGGTRAGDDGWLNGGELPAVLKLVGNTGPLEVLCVR